MKMTLCACCFFSLFGFCIVHPNNIFLDVDAELESTSTKATAVVREVLRELAEQMENPFSVINFLFYLQ